MKRYFVYSPDLGFELFDAFEDAQKVAQSEIDNYRASCDGEWPDEAEHVYCGEVLAESKAVWSTGDEGREYVDYVLEALPAKEITQ